MQATVLTLLLAVGVALAQDTGDVQGALVATGSYSGGVSPAISYRTNSRGTNAAGPYQLTLYLDALPADDPEALLEVAIMLALPGVLAPGTYEIGPMHGRALGEGVRATVNASAYGRMVHLDFDADALGAIDIVDMGDELTASFSFLATDDEGRTLTASGRVVSLALIPRGESSVSLSGAVQAGPARGVSAAAHGSEGVYAMVFAYGSAHEVILRFADDLEPGTHRIVGGDGTVLPPGASATGSVVGVDGPVTGTLTLEAVGRYLAGTFTFEVAAADGVVHVAGDFSGIVPFALD